MSDTICFDVYRECVEAVQAGELIESVSPSDKEFHFQNWFGARLGSLDGHFEVGGRNTYPDFALVEHAEGYEVKGLAWPGRDRSYDANSQLPTGFHNGRTVFYVFGRYPADLTPYEDVSGGGCQYPVVDLVICHGDFLNADHEYVHENKSFSGLGTYGDIMVRDRKMYVAPTPFALTTGTTGLMTLIVPDDMEAPIGFRDVGRLVRTEAEELVVAYEFDLRSNELRTKWTRNPYAGQEHRFVAYRIASQGDRAVAMAEPEARTG